MYSKINIIKSLDALVPWFKLGFSFGIASASLYINGQPFSIVLQSIKITSDSTL